MLADSPQTPYEVFCHHCRVTFPVGTKQCIHCGGGLARHRSGTVLPSREVAPEPLAELELPRRGFSPTTLVWAVLLLSGALYRACAPAPG